MRKEIKIMILILTLFVVLTLSVMSVGAKVNLKFAHDCSLAHIDHIAALKFQELIESKSNGEIEITIFPQGQLGHQREIAEGIIMGTVDIGLVSSGPMPSWLPDFQLWGVPFLIRDREHAFKVLDGEIGEKWKQDMLAQGMLCMGYGEIGMRHLTNNVRPIHTVEDMAGLKFRVHESKIWIATMKALNATGVPIAFGELYTTLQQGVVDGQENPYATINSMKFYEVQKYCTATGHTFTPNLFLVNPKKFNSFSKEDQELIKEVFAETIAYQRQYQIDMEASHLADIKAAGMEVDENPVRIGFIEATKNVAEAVKDDVPPDLVEKIRDIK